MKQKNKYVIIYIYINLHLKNNKLNKGNFLMNKNLNIEEIFEDIVSLINKDTILSRELFQAKNLFFKNVGKIHTSNPNYQNRINCFLNWFLFDWNIEKKPCVYKIIISRLDSNLFSQYHYQLSSHYHSIFYTYKTKKDIFFIKDLFSKKKYKVQNCYFFQGVEKEHCFESRLYLINNEPIFSNYLILHTVEANSYIKKAIKSCNGEIKKLKDLIIKLHKLAHQYATYKHFSIKKIYN